MNLIKKIDLSTMIAVTIMMVVILFNTRVNGQRTHYDIDREESLRGRRPSNVDRTDIGQFPYNRGETPIFNFDIGDEDFLKTIPDLVTGLRDMANVVAEQTKVTGAYGAAFLDCPDCKF